MLFSRSSTRQTVHLIFFLNGNVPLPLDLSISVKKSHISSLMSRAAPWLLFPPWWASVQHRCKGTSCSAGVYATSFLDNKQLCKTMHAFVILVHLVGHKCMYLSSTRKRSTRMPKAFSDTLRARLSQ